MVVVIEPCFLHTVGEHCVDSRVFEWVAGTFEGKDIGMVPDAVDLGSGHYLVAEDVSPACKRQV